jgi:hypothetical protein
MATAWSCGLPAAISVRMFSETTFFDFPLLSGMAKDYSIFLASSNTWGVGRDFQNPWYFAKA